MQPTSFFSRLSSTQQANGSPRKARKVFFLSIDDENYCFVRTIQDRTACIIPYVYEFQPDKTVLLKIASKVRGKAIKLSLQLSINFLLIFNPIL